jgi:hypothetical protein
VAKALIFTPFEEERVYASAYAGKRARLCLAVNTGSLGLNSTTAQWDAVELSGNGYARYQWTIPAGSYNSTTGRFEAAAQLCEFLASANGQGLTWNTVYLVLGTIANNVTTWNAGVSAILAESPNVAVVAGQAKSYNVRLLVNGLEVTS